MDTLETKRMEMFIHTVENRQQFPQAAAEGSRGAELYDELGQIVEDLRGNAYEQSRAQSSLREISSAVAATRGGLVKQLDSIRRTVRITGLPNLDDKFNSPQEVPDQALLTMARTYGNDAFPIKDDLIRRGLGPDFINDLSEAAQAFDAALDERTQGLSKQVAATAEIDRLIERGMRVVRELSVIVRNVYADDQTKLSLWESISHVEKVGRRSRPADDDGEPPPPAQG